MPGGAVTSPSRGGNRVLVLSQATARLLDARLPDSAEICVVSGAAPSGAEAWRFETSGGAEIDLPLSAARAWERPPYAMLVRLSAGSDDRHLGRDAGEKRRIVAEAVIGTRGEFGALLDKLTSTMAALLRSGLDDLAMGPSVASPPAPARQQPLRLALLEGRLRRAAHRWKERLLAERWAVGIVAQSIGSLVDGEPLAPAAWIEPGPLGDLADPHPWPGTTSILCEEILRDPPGLGRIVALELHAGSSRIAAVTPLLGGSLHRSFPGAHAYEGETLLLPETPGRGETTLYSLATDGTLEPVYRVAPRLRMADPTLFWHGGFAWIAYTDLDLGVHDNLCLLHAPDVYGPWHPHRRNPVKIDIRSARPAGPLLQHRGALYRPAQDCARDYGAAVVLHRVEALTTESFREVPVRRIEPSRKGGFPDGLHTLAGDGDRILIDGKRLALQPMALAAKVYRRSRPLLRGKKVVDA